MNFSKTNQLTFSLPPLQLLEALHEKEKNIHSLQNYASLIFQRIMEQAPDMLETVLQLQESEESAEEVETLSPI